MKILNDINNSETLAESILKGEMGKSIEHDEFNVSPYDEEDEEYKEDTIAYELYHHSSKFYLLTRGTGESDEAYKVAMLDNKPTQKKIKKYIENL